MAKNNRKGNFSRRSYNNHSCNRHTQNRRSNDDKFYPGVKKSSRFLRDHISPDIFSKIKNKGPFGQAIGFCGDKLIEKPLHNACFSFVGMFYDKNKDKPVLGSLLYFVVFMLVTSLLAAIVGSFVR